MLLYKRVTNNRRLESQIAREIKLRKLVKMISDTQSKGKL